MSKSPSLFGGACIIASTCVGAGMLGLPSAGAGAWTLWSLFALILTMIVMTLSGWLLLEAFKHYDLRVSFHTVTQELLGANITRINNLAVYFVGGILLYAYTTSSGLILQDMLDIDSKLASIVCVLVFAGFVWHSTRAVDRISIVMIVFMLLSFVFGIFGLATDIKLPVLFDSLNQGGEYAPYTLAMFPVALASFGYHHSVASMRAYYGGEQRAKYAILGGTAIALGFYVLWVVSIFGNLPRADFGVVIAQGGDVHVLLNALDSVIDSEQVSQAINAFSIAALLSSFIGVGLGVFDFIADLFKFDNSRKGRSKTWLVTFLPPLILSLLSPFGFVMAIGYAGAAATIWTCIIPVLLARKSRQLPEGQTGLVVPGGKFSLGLVLLFGIFTALFHFLAMADLLPAFTG